jgi:hypothetical protein
MNYDKTLYINPQKISRASGNGGFNVHNDPVVEGGEWDTIDIMKIEDFIVYKSIHQLLKENVQWEDTELYKFIVRNLELGNPIWDCRTIEQCKNRGNYILNLRDDIVQTDGLLSREEVMKLKTKFKTYHVHWEGKRGQGKYWENDTVQFVIDRNGKFLFAMNGSHRFSICKILGYKSIPVKVYKRHSEWEEYRKTVFNFCETHWKGKAYHSLPHPDFDELQAIHSDNRYELIKNNTSLKNVKLLDIGSLFGYICYKAEQDGFNCTAVEFNNQYLSIMRKLHAAMEMKYRIFSDSIFNLDDKSHEIVIAFNIFQCFLKTEELYAKLIKLLNELDYKEMFIQFHNKNETQLIGAYKNYSEEEFAKFIINNSKNKTSFEYIGTENSREIYKIY